MNIDTIKIGKNILALRKEKGLTQQQLAETLGVTNKAVSKWETGEGLPDISILPALAEALGITIDALLCVALHSQKDESSAIQHQILQKKAESFKIQCLIAALICIVGVLLAWMIWKERQTYYAVGLGLVLELIGLAVYEIFLLKFNNQLVAYNSTAIQPKENPYPRRRFYSATVWVWSIIPLWYIFSSKQISSIFFRGRSSELAHNIVAIIIYLAICLFFSLLVSGRKDKGGMKSKTNASTDAQ